MNIMFNNITQSGMTEIARCDAWNIASHMVPDMNNFGRRQVAKSCDEVTKY